MPSDRTVIDAQCTVPLATLVGLLAGGETTTAATQPGGPLAGGCVLSLDIAGETTSDCCQ